MTGSPLVSIIIPTFNGRPWIRDAIDSALAQSYPYTEVIVVDDGSTDGTDDLLLETYGVRIRYHRQENRGLSGARNAGIALARGRYVQFLDADDLLLPRKIEQQVEALESHARYTVAYCDFAFIQGATVTPIESGFRDRYVSGDAWAALLNDNFIVVHAALARLADVRAVGGFDEGLRASEDYDLWLRLADRGRTFLHTPGVLVLYRRTGSSMSADARRQIASTIEVIEKASRLRAGDKLTDQIRRRRLAQLRDHMLRSTILEGLLMLKKGRYGTFAKRFLQATGQLVSAAKRSVAGRVQAWLDPLGAKRRGELQYWIDAAAASGSLGSDHYEWFFTDHFGLAREDYQDGRVLDIGCGPRGSLEWADMATQRVGLDPLALQYRSLGTTGHRMRYVAAASDAMPFPDGHFDIVTSFNSLDHVDDLPRTIPEIVRVLRPGGIFLLLVEVNQPPTVVEPITLEWETPDLFKPGLVLEQVRHYEMTGDGLYASVRAGLAYDHSRPAPRSGILSAMFKKN